MNDWFTISRSSAVVGLLLAAFSVVACTSSSGAGGGAGSGGGAGVGGHPSDGGGSDAAGAAGSDAGSATDAQAEAAPAAPELNTCGDPAKLGAAVAMSQMVSLNFGDRSTTAMDGSVVWLGQLNNASEPQELDIQLYKNAAPFGATLSSMSIDLMGQSDFQTCGACVFFHPRFRDGGVPLRNQPNYVAKSGTLNVTAVPTGTGMKLTAMLSNVTFEHVMVDSLFTTTKLDDCTITLTSASIDATVP